MLLWLLSLVFVSVCARVSNVTIDDTLGDELTGQIPQYMPDGWTARSVSGAPCTGCTAQPDATHIYKGTWHDKTTYIHEELPSTISFSFNGTRVYVYFILFNNIGTVNNNTRLRFYLDGSSDPARDFLHLGDPAGEKYLYNQLVYDSQALAPANHTLLISSYRNETDGSVALFDRAVYTTGTDDDPATQITTTSGPAPSPSAPVPTSQSDDGNRRNARHVGVVIGCSVAGALILLLATGYWVCFRRRRRRRGEPLDAVLRSQGAQIGAHGATRASGLPPSPDDSALLRNELGQMREELARVRRIAEPPQYTQVSISS